jgi:hypothetical protein
MPELIGQERNRSSVQNEAEAFCLYLLRSLHNSTRSRIAIGDYDWK